MYEIRENEEWFSSTVIACYDQFIEHRDFKCLHIFI